MIAILLPQQAPLVAAGAEYARHAGQDLVDRYEARNAEVLEQLTETAVGESGLSVDMFLAAMAGDDRRLLALGMAVDAATRTTLSEKIGALGRSLGKLAVDDALIDPESLWIEVFSRIDRPHVKVLLAIRAAESASSPPAVHSIKAHELAASTRLGPLVYPILETLVNLGLIRESVINGGMSYGPDSRFAYPLILGPLGPSFFERLELGSDTETEGFDSP